MTQKKIIRKRIKDGWVIRTFHNIPRLVLDCICTEQPGASSLPPASHSSGIACIAQWDPKLKRFWCWDCGAIAPKDVTLFAELCYCYKRENEYEIYK